MNIALWVIQALLAVAFLGSGIMKISQPIEKQQAMMDWIKHTTSGVVRLIGVAEILVAVGLILPAALHILPWLTPIAAVGLVVIMFGAIVVHMRLHELPKATPALILLLLGLVVVVGRFVIMPIA